MYNRFIQHLNKSTGYTRYVLLGLMMVSTIFTAQANLIINQFTSNPSGYQPGMTTSVEFIVDFEATDLEFTDYLVMNFPVGWNVSLTPGQALPMGNFCGPVVVSGQGTNQLILGNDNPGGNPVGGSGCGVISPGVYSIFVDVSSPAGTVSDQTVGLQLYGDGFGVPEPDFEEESLILMEITCSFTCPDDMTISAMSGLCGAEVTIPLPVVVGTCNPDPQDMSGFYPVGTTEVIFTADGGAATGELSCSMLVTVTDDVAPEFIVCEDVVVDLDPGKCLQVLNFPVTVEENCEAQAVFLTQNTDPTFVDNSVACPGGESKYYRVFDMDALGVNTNIQVSSLEIGIFQTFNNPMVTVRVHELNGALNAMNLTLVSENTLMLPNLLFQIYNFPIVAEMEIHKTYVIEVVTPGSVFSGFVMGANTAGQSGDSFFQSNFCAVPDITNLNAIGFGNFHLVMNIIGNQDAYTVEQTAGLPSGSAFPIGTTTNTYVVTDIEGNSSNCTFDVQVNGFDNPVNSLACNDHVNVSLNQNCEGIITPDMVLEGGPYTCYEDYSIVIKDLFDNEYGEIITSDMLGLDLIVEVHDGEGNSCWGQIVIEDKLAPELLCSTRTTQCTESTTPGSPLASEIRINASPAVAIPASEPSSIDIPIEINGLNGATISDLNLELSITHSYVSDLGAVLISPEGTEITLFVQINGDCSGDDLELTLDDEAMLTYADLNNSCDIGSIPTIEGSFQSNTALSSFDGENPNGTWILRIIDLFVGDGGSVDDVVFEFTQQGGVVGLPIPETATYTTYGQNTFYVIGLDPCSPTILSYEDVTVKMDCSSPFTKVIYRSYTAEDESGNMSIGCTDTIQVLRTDLGSLEFPANHDDLELPSFSCEIAYPLPDVSGAPTGAFCDNVEVTYEDIVIDVCAGSYKILRYWSVYEWCTSTIVEHTQIIKVIDTTAPELMCPNLFEPISTLPNSCEATFFLSAPTITDNCTEDPTYTVESQSGVIVDSGNGHVISGLEPGVHIVTYTATDDCGNSSSCDMVIEVQDLVPPTAVCDEHTTVSLTFEPVVDVYAFTFDDGSHDDCGPVTYSARRMDNTCDVPNWDQFADKVRFCCEDIGNIVMVEFRVEDEQGLYNTCMVEVEVKDKLAPAIQLPPNVTIACHDVYDDPLLTGGYAIGYDNCEVEITFVDNPQPTECGEGEVYRSWIATDKSGNQTVGIQIISLVDDDPFDINDIEWAADVTLTNCIEDTHPDKTGYPILTDDICSEVSLTYDDDVFTVVGEACYQILRTWTVIDDCKYNLNNPQIGVGWWKDIQVINIQNNTAPTWDFTCEDITIDGYGACEDDVTLGIAATDDCTPKDELVYTWKVDEFNEQDGIFEYSGVGSSLSIDGLEFGQHRVIWTVSDQCGNKSTCDYLFDLVDAKAPTPYCLNSLSTAVMNNNGMVSIWVSDFDLGATDNCTPQDELVLSFDSLNVETSITFGCDDITNGIGEVIELQLWVTDLAGNKDYCTVTILVEDNEADFCDDAGSIVVNGKITNLDDEILKHVDVTASSLLESPQTMNTGESGQFSFDLIPNGLYNISAEKDDDVLNGITTLDIVLIQKHILALKPFDSPYQIIAGDVNNNNKVTGSDIVVIRKLILGLTDIFPNDQKSWRFVDRSEVFPDPTKPFPFSESIQLDLKNNTNTFNEMVAVKIGDVNQTAKLDNFDGTNIQNRDAQQLDFTYESASFKAGDRVSLNITSENFHDIVGYQTTFEFDQGKFNFLGFDAGELDVTDASFNFQLIEQGIFSHLWSSQEAKSVDDILFTLHFEAKTDGNSANMLFTSSNLTESIAYDAGYNELEIVLESRGDEIVQGEDINTFNVYQNTPNPFDSETAIRFDIPETGEISIEIFNVNGQLVYNTKQIFTKGMNNVVIQKDMLVGSGVYFYKISNNSETKSYKMILLD